MPSAASSCIIESMLRILIQKLFSPDNAASSAMAIAAVLGLLAFLLRPKREGSNFKLREADRPKDSHRDARAGSGTAKHSKSSKLGEAKMERVDPLKLEGIRIDLKPHEILGVAAGASPAEIQKAYRELMKRYHPDLVGPPDSRQWKDAQKIAEAIIRAKDEMLKRAKS